MSEFSILSRRQSVLLASVMLKGRYDSSAVSAWIQEHRVDGLIFASGPVEQHEVVVIGIIGVALQLRVMIDQFTIAAADTFRAAAVEQHGVRQLARGYRALERRCAVALRVDVRAGVQQHLEAPAGVLVLAGRDRDAAP